MKAKKSLFYVCMLVMACIMSAVSCVKEEHGTQVEEGLPASLKLSFSVPVFEDMPVTKAGAETETQVQQLALIFYKKSDTNKPFYFKVIDNLGNGQIKNSDTNLEYLIDIPVDEGLLSGEYYMYAIANWGSAFCNIKYGDHDTSAGRFESLSLAELKEEIISRIAENNQYDVIGTTPMSGKFGPLDGDGSITLNPGKNDFTGTSDRIHLRRAVAKVILKFKNGDFTSSTGAKVTFVPESYDIYNFPQSSTLMERDGWENDTKPGTGLNCEVGKTYRNFIDMKFEDTKSDTITFYMLENVQKAKTDRGALPSKEMREKRVSESDETFKYAPERSTYVVVRGRYSGPISKDEKTHVEGDATYTIQLGDFNDGSGRGGIDNFTIRRNVKYTYNVTINGVHSIVTEATAESFDKEDRPGAEGNLVAIGDKTMFIELDAHYSKVLLRIKKSDWNNPFFYVNTPFSFTKGEGVQPNNLTEVPDDAKDCNWIHFSKPQVTDGKITFGLFNNGEGLANVFELLQELSTVNGADAPKEGAHYVVNTEDGVDYVYTTAYVDEYFYTENPNGGAVALKDFVNKPDRTMNICTSKAISKDGKSTYVAETIISFRQNAIHTVYPLESTDPDYNPFGIEKTSEWEALKRATNITNGELNDVNGWHNTWLLKEYVRESTGNNILPIMKSIGYVFDAANTTRPRFETSILQDETLRRPSVAAMSRNRDANDDGKIDEDELKWYMPARNQCIALWMGNNDLGEYRPYNADGLEGKTADKVKGPEGIVHTSSAGNSRVWWAIEGCSFGNQNDTAYTMRCVRNLNETKYKEAPSQFSSCANNIITINGLSDNCIRGSYKVGEYSAGHTERMGDNRLPHAFEVATSDLVVSIPNPTITGKSSSVTITTPSLGYRNYNYTANLLIESIPAGATLSCSAGTLTAVSGEDYNYQVVFSRTGISVVGSSSGDFTITMKTAEGFESSGVVVTCDPGTKNNGTVSYTPSVKSNETKTYSTFTRDQINRLVNLAAANYTQEADGSDKGQWRVPNQRELSLISAYVLTKDIDNSNFYGGTDTGYACSTFFTAGKSSKKTNPYHVYDITNASESKMTLGANTSYRIRPVRDVRTSTVEYDAQYGNGGTGFGIK